MARLIRVPHSNACPFHATFPAVGKRPFRKVLFLFPRLLSWNEDKPDRKLFCPSILAMPILVLTEKPRPALSREEGLKRITDIRNKFGLTRRTK
ncbi:hypothetical protein OIPHN330_29770 [Citrobacter freundii]|nr:hypothetical protein OIPHN330_29770 [Citrobacter freundii]BEJ40312.1 hypothetical protein OIPHN354_30240 [Citrobacter freundii]